MGEMLWNGGTSINSRSRLPLCHDSPSKTLIMPAKINVKSPAIDLLWYILSSYNAYVIFAGNQTM
jgi:hypothetical protein